MTSLSFAETSVLSPQHVVILSANTATVPGAIAAVLTPSRGKSVERHRRADADRLVSVDCAAKRTFFSTDTKAFGRDLLARAASLHSRERTKKKKLKSGNAEFASIVRHSTTLYTRLAE